MNTQDIFCLLPFIILSFIPVILMTIIAIRRNFEWVFGLSMAGFFLSLISTSVVWPWLPHQVGSLLMLDGFSMLFFWLFLVTGAVVALLAHTYLKYQEEEKEEFFIILYTAILGSVLLASAISFVTFFLGIEMLSLSLYILIAYRRSKEQSLEAATKYLILASASSAFLLFGMGLIYAGSGSLGFIKIATMLQPGNDLGPYLLTGFSFMAVGLGFKLAVFPFHMWTPDVYEGAPVPVTTFVATVSKGAVMAFLLRFFLYLGGAHNAHFVFLITALSLLSMFTGNLLAIRQQNIKRILAYSSIANMGYLLIPLLIGDANGIRTAVFYIASYLLTTLGAFSVVSLVSSGEVESGDLGDYRGLFRKHPLIALILTLAMLSLAGLPLTAGFMAKFYLVFSGLHAGLWLLAGGLIINSVIALYYYLRIISLLYQPPQQDLVIPKNPTGIILLLVIGVGILWLGLFPGGFIRLVADLATIGTTMI